ncbi:MAG: acetate--CoA ligase family protein [Archaeoglobus sp.]|nr:acetate--CoA ligase family protein [Archaeoglobus sp.]
MLLLEHESKKLLEGYGINTARCIFAEKEDDAVKAAISLGFPVAMKVASREITHKSNVGGVILEVKDEKEVRDAFRRLIRIKHAEGVNVQPMLERGIEVIVGATENEQFGSILMFGLGGVFVEAIRDISMRLIPITRRDAEEMIKETKVYGILKGYRGFKGDLEALIELLLKVSRIVEREDIAEMDLNPVFVYEKGYAVADARIVKGRKRKGAGGETRETIERKIERIGEILNPRSVAVIGASNQPLKVGYMVLKSLSTNPELKIYPINPNLEEIEGLKLKVHPSIESVKADLAIVAVPADKVIEVVKDCIGRVKGVLIISSGFKEADERGKVLQNELAKIAQENEIKIIGPNTFGIVNVRSSINASFTPMFSKLRKGSIALVSQSGGMCHYFMQNFIEDVGFSYILHLGNRCDVDFPEVLRFLKEDRNTKVVALYIEGVEKGRELFEAVSELSEIKPVVVLKAGKSKMADVVSRSHTGSLAGDYGVFISAMKQANAIVVETPLELLDVSKALERIGGKENKKESKIDDCSDDVGAVIATVQAGLGFTCLDIFEERGGNLAKLSDETIKRLHELLPPITMRDNPIDLSFSVLNLDAFREVLKTLSNDSCVGLIVFLLAVSPSWTLPHEIILDILREVSKPMVIVYSSTPDDFRELRVKAESLGIPTYPTIERGARVAARLLSYMFP